MKNENNKKTGSKILSMLFSALVAAVLAVFVFIVINY